MKLKHIAILAALLPATGGLAWANNGPPGDHHGDEQATFGQPGDPKRPSRLVLIDMVENDGGMSFAPAVVNVRQGEQIKFALRNNGVLDHEIILATLKMNLAHAEEMKKNPDMEHDEPNAKRIAPGKTAEIIWQFTKTGEFDFSCLIPGHREAGMHGKIIVKSSFAAN